MGHYFLDIQYTKNEATLSSLFEHLRSIQFRLLLIPMPDLNNYLWSVCLRIHGDPRVEEEDVEPKQRYVAPVAQRN